MTTVELSHHVVDAAFGDDGASAGDAADAPAVLLLHSLGADRTMWGPQIAGLEGVFRFIAVDLRGHGDSPAPEGPYDMGSMALDVIEVLDRLGVERAHVAGVSMGGAVAQQLALDHPDRVESLALISTAARFGEPGTWTGKAATVSGSGTGALADGVVSNWFTDACFETTPALPARYADGIRATSDVGYAGCCGAIAGFDSRDRLGSIEPRVASRTLVLAGEQDTSTPLETVRVLHERIPGSRMVTLSPARHLLTVELADLATAALSAHWLRED